jgi:hypothetical protein
MIAAVDHPHAATIARAAFDKRKDKRFLLIKTSLPGYALIHRVHRDAIAHRDQPGTAAGTMPERN